MKYRFIIDHHSEGWSLSDAEYETVTDAVKDAAKLSYGSPFLIITIVEWEAKPL